MRVKKPWPKRKMPRLLRKLAHSELNPKNRVHARVNRANAPSVSAILLFTTNSSLTAIGSRPAITAMSFTRAKLKVRVGGLIPTAAGSTPTPVGHGFRKNRSVGPPITTDAGRVCAELAGFGSPEINGRRPGFRGARAPITSVGRRCRPKRVSINAPAFAIGLTVITTLVRTNIVLSQVANLARREWSKRSYRRNAM